MVEVNFNSDTDENIKIPNDFILGQIEDALIYGGGQLIREPLDIYGVRKYFDSNNLMIDMATYSGNHYSYIPDNSAFESGVFRLGDTELEYFFLRRDVVQNLYAHRRNAFKIVYEHPIHGLFSPLDELLDLELTDEEVRKYLLESIQQYRYGLIEDVDHLLKHAEYLDTHAPSLAPIYDEEEDDQSIEDMFDFDYASPLNEFNTNLYYD